MQTLKKLSRNLLKLINAAEEKKLIADIRKVESYFHDFPRFPMVEVKLRYKNRMETYRTYLSIISYKKALEKLLGETIERYCLTIFNKKEAFFESYQNLRKKAIDPKIFLPSEFRVQLPQKIYSAPNEKIYWIKAISLIEKKVKLFPAQLIYLKYPFRKSEPFINFADSNGAAFFTSWRKAVLKGLLEVIERDAFFINYLLKLTPNIINIEQSKCKLLQNVAALIKRYNLELYILDISIDVPCYSICALLLDKSGVGPAVSVGGKADLNLISAITGAIEESLQIYLWLRKVMLYTRKEMINIFKKNEKNSLKISTFEERGLLWSSPRSISKIEFFLQGKKISLNSLPLWKSKSLNELITWFKKEKIEILCVNVTPHEMAKKGLFTVKILIPSFQPLYLNEQFPLFRVERLKKVANEKNLLDFQINKFPHPFL